MANDVVTCPSCEAKNRVPGATKGRPTCAKCGADLPWLVDATDAQFDAAVDTNHLVLVDLWAPWCGPCRMVAPILEKMSREFAGSLKVVKVNVDESPAVARRFNATSIPMLVFMRNGAHIDTIVGAQPESVMRTAIDSLVSNA